VAYAKGDAIDVHGAVVLALRRVGQPDEEWQDPARSGLLSGAGLASSRAVGEAEIKEHES
jgi:hypothetical protein